MSLDKPLAPSPDLLREPTPDQVRGRPSPARGGASGTALHVKHAHSAVIPAERSESRDPYPPAEPIWLMPANMDPGPRRWRGSRGVTAEYGRTAEPTPDQVRGRLSPRWGQMEQVDRAAHDSPGRARTQGIFFTTFGSRPNSFAALPPRMLRLACSLRNGRS